MRKIDNSNCLFFEKAPNVIVPQDCTNPNTLLLVINFGDLSVISWEISKDVFYNTYSIELAQLNVKLTYLNVPDVDVILLHNFQISLLADMLLNPSESHNFKFKVLGNLNSIHVNISPKVVAQLFLIFKALQLSSAQSLPTKNEPASSSAPTTTSSSSPPSIHPPKFLQFSLVASSIVFNLDEDQTLPLLSLQISNLCTNLSLEDQYMVLDLSVGNLCIEDKIQKESVYLFQSTDTDLPLVLATLTVYNKVI